MSQNVEKIERRKENITAVEPLLSAMRTISLAQWRSSLNKGEKLNSFIHELEQVQEIVLKQTGEKITDSTERKNVLLIVGGNRGFCGNFHKNIKDHFLNDETLANTFEIFLLGKELERIFRQYQIPFHQALLSPKIKQIYSFVQTNLFRETGQPLVSSISVLYDHYLGAGRYQTTLTSLDSQKRALPNENSENFSEYIIDTDPKQFLAAIYSLLIELKLQSCLLSSLASENSKRFSIMETADKNVENLISELEIILQEQRKGKITTESQEIAVSSGLLTSNQ